MTHHRICCCNPNPLTPCVACDEGECASIFAVTINDWVFQIIQGPNIGEFVNWDCESYVMNKYSGAENGFGWNNFGSCQQIFLDFNPDLMGPNTDCYYCGDGGGQNNQVGPPPWSLCENQTFDLDIHPGQVFLACGSDPPEDPNSPLPRRWYLSFINLVDASNFNGLMFSRLVTTDCPDAGVYTLYRLPTLQGNPTMFFIGNPTMSLL